MILNFSSSALDKDFYKRQKAKEKMRKERLKTASSHTQKRKKNAQKREEKARGYSKVRKRIVKEREKREKLFEKEEARKAALEVKKLKQAQKFAKSKRKKVNQDDWKSQNIEYDIQRPEGQ